MLDMWPGYSCAVKCLNDGFFLNVDTSTKFIQQKTIYHLLEELIEKGYTNKDISDKLCPKYEDNESQMSAQSDIDKRRLVVITSYNSASYQIELILWDQNPLKITFMWNERDPLTGNVSNSKVNLAEYLQRRYKI